MKYYRYNSEWFTKSNDPNVFYILGFIAADGSLLGKTKEDNNRIIRRKKNPASQRRGCRIHTNHRISIGINKKDIKLLEAIRDMVIPGKPILKKEKYNAVVLNIDNIEIYHFVESFGIKPRKSYSLEFPSNLSADMVSHFIRGYYDGDGTIGIVKGQRKLKTTGEMAYYYGPSVRILGTKEFLSGIIEFLHENIGLNKVKEFCRGNFFSCGYSFDPAFKFLSYIYNESELKLSRKYDKYKYILNADSNKLALGISAAKI